MTVRACTLRAQSLLGHVTRVWTSVLEPLASALGRVREAYWQERFRGRLACLL